MVIWVLGHLGRRVGVVLRIFIALGILVRRLILRRISRKGLRR